MPKRKAFLAASLVLASVLSLHRAWSGPPAAAVQARTDAAAKAYTHNEALFKTGRTTVETVYLWSKRWADAKGGNAAAGEHLKRMTDLEAKVAAQVQSGMATQADVAAAAYYKAEAEILASP